MTQNLTGKTIALLQRMDLKIPNLPNLKSLRRCRGRGDGYFRRYRRYHWQNGTEVDVDMAVDDADVAEYDGLLLPGGVANPDAMRQNDMAVSFVRGFFTAENQSLQSAMHRGLLIEADVVKGRTLTSWPNLKPTL